MAKLATGPKDCQGTQGPVNVRDGVDGSFAHALLTGLSEHALKFCYGIDWQGFDCCVRLKVQEALAGSQVPGVRRHREGCPSPRDRGGSAEGRDEWDFAVAIHDGLQTFVVCLLVH